MEYRLVRLGEGETYAQVFDEETSELIGSVIKTKRFRLFRAYQLRLDDKVMDLVHHLLNPRSWSIADYHVGFRWKLLGRKMTLDTGEESYTTSGLSRGKLVLTNEQGRTAMELDPGAFSSADMMRVTSYERVELYGIIAGSVLAAERYSLW